MLMRSRPRSSRRPSALLVWLVCGLALLSACTGDDDLLSSKCGEWVAPSESALSQDWAAEETIRGYHLLVECYAEAPDKVALLRAGWESALAEAKRAGSPTQQTNKSFDAASSKAITEFDEQLRALMTVSTTTLPPATIAEAAIAGMADALMDDHTRFQDPDTWQRHLAFEQGRSVGPGLNTVRTANGSLVWEVFPTGPASKAGVRPGDLITSVNGRSLVTTSDDPVVLSQPGVPDRLNITRDGAGFLEILVFPAVSQLPILTATLIEGDLAYLRLSTFLTNPAEFQKTADPEIDRMASRDPSGWIVDLRNNSGGRLDVQSYVAARLGLTGKAGTFVHRGRRAESMATGESVIDNAPVVVLINERSASAAEMMAFSLQDAGLAYVIGEESRGIVNGSNSFPLLQGALWITTVRLLIGEDERQIGGIGVTPDREVALTSAGLAAGHDAQLEAAIDYIRQR